MSCSISLMCSDLAQIKVENGCREERMERGRGEKQGPHRAIELCRNRKCTFVIVFTAPNELE